MGDTPEHLKPTQFRPGHAPTPGAGRPRKRPLSDRYAAMLESTFPKDLCKKLGLPLGSSWGEAITEVHFRTALRSTEAGNAARKEVREAIEGKAPMRFELRQDGEVEFRIVYEEPLVKRRIEDEKKVIDVKQLPASEAEKSTEETGV